MNGPEMAASVLTDAHAKIDTLTGNLLAALEEGDKLTCARVNPKSASCCFPSRAAPWRHRNDDRAHDRARTRRTLHVRHRRGPPYISPSFAQTVGCKVWGQITGFVLTGQRLDMPRCDELRFDVQARTFKA